MKKRLQTHFITGIMLLSAVLFLLPPVAHAAGEKALLTPASGISQTGNTFDVSVDGYVGHTYSWFIKIGANSAEGTLTYPANLKVVSFDTSNSSFPSGMNPVASGNTITFKGKPSSGTHMDKNVHLFSVKFQSVTPGQAEVKFGTVRYGNLGTASTTGGLYTVNAPPPAPSPSPKPTPKPSVTPKPSTRPAPVATTPAPAPVVTPTPEEIPAPTTNSDGGVKIENVKVTANRQANGVAWTISDPNITPTVTYGTTKNNQKSQANVTKKEDGAYEASFDNLKLGTLYYFSIKATATDNLKGAEYNGSFTTRGYPVQLTIQQNNLLLPGAKVKIGDRSFTANKNAIISTELSNDTFEALITPADSQDTYPAAFTVAKKEIPANGSPELQSFVLNVETVGSSTNGEDTVTMAIVGSALASIAGIGGFAGFLIYRKRNAQQEVSPSVDEDLLMTNYGTQAEAYRTNTPEPNLDAANGATAPTPLPAEVTADTSVNVTEYPTNQDVAVAPQDTVAFTATDLPLPPAIPEMPTINNVPEQTEATSSYSEAEQISPELAQIEAAQVEDPDEPSAVYDESTGELDIIHHRPAGA